MLSGMQNVLAKYAFSASDWYQLGRSLLGENRMLQAGLCFKAAIAADVTCVEAWYNLAHCQEDLGLMHSANQSLVCALAVQPDYGAARGKLVQVLLHQGMEQQAFQVWWAGKKLWHQIRRNQFR